MLVVVNKDKLLKFLRQDAQCWSVVSGGANFDAFSFDPKTTDPQKLHELGYYTNREAWLAGVQSKKIIELIEEIENAPQAKAK
jgi:hypothetical protein